MIAVLLFPLLGWGLALALNLKLPPSLGARCGLAFLLGAGAHGTLLFAGGRVVLIIAYAIAVFAIFVKRFPQREQREPVAANIAVVAPFAMLLVATAIVPLSDYDGRTTWMMKAHAIANERSITGPYFRGERGFNPHNHYPLLLPLDAATMMVVSRDSTDHAARWLYVLIPLAFLLYARDLAPWLVACVAWLPMVITAPEGSAATAYADLAAMSFCGAAVISLARDERTTPLWLLFLVLTKNEGTVLGVAILTAMLFMRPPRRVWMSSFAAFAFGKLALALWRSRIPNAYDEQYSRLARDLPSHLDRIAPVARAFASHAADITQWGAFWIMALIAAVAATRRTRFAVVVIVLTLGVYITTFAMMNWDIADLANLSANRLLLHLVGPAILIVSDKLNVVD